MIEIYMMVSLAPVPMATWGNHEQSHVGQNYLKSLFALGFQGFLILICVAIYAVLIQNIAISGDAIGSIWSIVGTPYCSASHCSRPVLLQKLCWVPIDSEVKFWQLIFLLRAISAR